MTPTPRSLVLGLALLACACAATPVEPAAEPPTEEVETSADHAGPEILGSYCLAPGSSQRVVGVVQGPDGTPKVLRGMQAATAGDDTTLLGTTWGASEASTSDAPAPDDLWEFRTTPEALQMRRPGDAYRDATAWQTALALPVATGTRWDLRPGSGRPGVEASVETVETAQTLGGPISDCARVRTVRGGHPSITWWSPQRGLVRWEIRDPDGAFVGGLVVAGDPWPTDDEVLAFFTARRAD